MLVLVGLERGDIFLGFGGNRHGLGAFAGSNFFYFTAVFITRFGAGFIDIADVEHGFGGEKEQVVSRLLLLFAFKSYLASVASLLQYLFISLEYRHH